MDLILMVDGTPSIRLLYSFLLLSLGVSTLQAQRLSDALYYLKTKPQIDAIFLNLGYPPEPALDFILKVKQIVPHIPIVVISTMESQLSPVTRIMEKGSFAYLVAPTRRSDLRPIVNALELAASGKTGTGKAIL